MVQTIFNRLLLRQYRQKRAADFRAHAFLYDDVAARLLERLQDVKTASFKRVLEIGGRDGHLSQQLQQQLQPELLISTELATSPFPLTGGIRVQADEEFLPFTGESFDLVISHLNLHQVNDLPGVLAQIHGVLKEGGFFLASLWGENSLTELKQATMLADLQYYGGVSPRVFPFVDLRGAAGLLQRANFALPVADIDHIELSYAHIWRLAEDLRHMAENNILHHKSHKPSPKGWWLALQQIYQEKFTDVDGRLSVTADALFLSGWK
ncbi:MAG: class I SAM-dependent methyltransferase [Alphaproteobacteria bacterium]